MRIFFGIVLVIIGLMKVYALPETLIALWPQEAKTLSMAEEFWMAGIVSLPISIAFGAGLILLLPKKSK